VRLIESALAKFGTPQPKLHHIVPGEGSFLIRSIFRAGMV